MIESAPKTFMPIQTPDLDRVLCIVKNGQKRQRKIDSTYSLFLDPGTEDPTCAQTQKRGEKPGFETPKAQNCRTNLQGR